MKRRIVAISLLLVILMISGGAFASNNSNIDIVNRDVERTNQWIEDQVQKTIEYCESTDVTEEEIDRAIERLVRITNRRAQRTIRKADRMGITVECQLEKYIIGGREVWIDPLIVPCW